MLTFSSSKSEVYAAPPSCVALEDVLLASVAGVFSVFPSSDLGAAEASVEAGLASSVEAGLASSVEAGLASSAVGLVSSAEAGLVSSALGLVSSVVAAGSLEFAVSFCAAELSVLLVLLLVVVVVVSDFGVSDSGLACVLFPSALVGAAAPLVAFPPDLLSELAV